MIYKLKFLIKLWAACHDFCDARNHRTLYLHTTSLNQVSTLSTKDCCCCNLQFQAWEMQLEPTFSSSLNGQTTPGVLLDGFLKSYMSQVSRGNKWQLQSGLFCHGNIAKQWEFSKKNEQSCCIQFKCSPHRTETEYPPTDMARSWYYPTSSTRLSSHVFSL